MTERIVLTCSLSLSPRSPWPPPLAWVTNERAGTVTVIDTATDKPVATLKVGARPRGIEVSADGKRVYVALSDTARNSKGTADAIVVLDAQTRKVLDRYDAGSDPERFVLSHAVSPDGKSVYVADGQASSSGL